MNTERPFIGFTLLLLLLVAFPGRGIALNVEESGWSPDERVPGYLDDTKTPFLIADQNNVVHAFASQLVDDGKYRRLAVVYRKWTLAGGWTRPIDVLLLSPTGHAEVVGAFLDSKGIVHIVFFGEGNIYYSRVHVSRASDVSAWLLPVEVGIGAIDPPFAAISGDKEGNLVIAYNGNMYGNGVYYVASKDAGNSWSKPASIFITDNSQLTPYYIKGYIGNSDKFHLVWSVSEIKPSKSVFVSLYYDSMDIDAGQWDEPLLLERNNGIEGFFGPSVPTIVDNGKYLVVMYNSGNPYTGQEVPFGRPVQRVQISYDDGQSWEGSTNPFPLLTGNSGEFGLVVDSNQVVHAIFIMRIDRVDNGVYSSIGGVWHSELRDNNWTNPTLYHTSINPVNLRAVVSQGNVLLVTWIADPETGGEGVWYSYTVLNSPKLPVVIWPTLPITSTLTATPFFILSPVATPTPGNKSLQAERGNTSYTPMQSLLCGIIPIILLIIGIIIAILLRDRRKG